ncbi:hypothetical protein HY494_02005 [Candidatus Woesearchaeota archaeon]|nr:hypothetical protein [Candidatus Woesearchaeota archaeon]
MSLERKVIAGMLAVLNGTACNDENYSASLGGVTIYEAVTDSDGKAHFTEEETGEEVEVALDPPVSDATILYFDNYLSEGFLISHPAFSPQLNIALHNSSHTYSLTPAPLQILHDGLQKEKSKPGAETYLSWAEANWEHTGCLNRGSLVTLMKAGVYLMKKLGIVETVGFSDDKLDQGAQYIEENLPESAVAEVYVFIPYKHGFSASTTTITALDISFSGECTDDNPGNNPPGDGNGSDCGNLLFCDYFEGTAINSNKWNVINDNGIDVYGGWLSLPNASSIATQKGLGSSCPDKSVDLRAMLDGGSIYVGNGMGVSAVNDTGYLNCGNETKTINMNTGTENTISLYKSGGLLSLLVNGNASSIPCNQDITSLQITSGMNDLVEVDYVEAKCK